MGEDFGIGLKPLIRSDVSAAIGMSYRRGLAGKSRHVQVQYWWIQQEVANEHVKIQRVLGGDNPADALTKIYPGGRAPTPHCPDELLVQECGPQGRKIDHGVPAYPGVG